MRLIYYLAESENDRRLHPDGGYWCAITDKGGYDSVGADPLTAISRLVIELERVLKEETEMHE